MTTTSLNQWIRRFEVAAVLAICAGIVAWAAWVAWTCVPPDTTHAGEPAANALSETNRHLLGPTPEEVERIHTGGADHEIEIP